MMAPPNIAGQTGLQVMGVNPPVKEDDVCGEWDRRSEWYDGEQPDHETEQG